MIDARARLLRRGDYIYGSFVRPSSVDGYIVAVNPGDRGDVLGRFAFSLSSVDDAMGAARAAFPVWSAEDVDDRAAAVRRLADLLSEQVEALAMLITRESGKPLWEARAEVNGAVRAIRLVVSDGLPALQPHVLREGAAWSEVKGLGVVAVVTPFTYPLLVPAVQVAAALLAGNSVVYKPSKFTPGVGQALAEQLDRCRLPRGTFNLVQGSGASVGARLVAHPDVDAVLFTGSWDTARRIRRATSHRPELPVWCQTGGKGVGFVLSDCDPDLAAYELATSAFATAGQRHDATARILVSRDLFDVLSECLVRRTAQLRIGYGFDDDVFMGPMISDAHRKRYRAHTEALTAAGHTVLADGGPMDASGRRGWYVSPSIHWVTRGGDLDDEPPGPSLQLWCVQDAEQMIEVHEQLAHRVCAAIFSRREDKALALARRLDTGTVHLNRGTAGGSLRLAAVGRGRAGNGVPSTVDLVRVLSAPSAWLIDRRPYDAARFVPGAGTLPVAVADGATMTDD